MPTSISTPIRAGTPSAVPVASSRPIAPVAANGMETSRMIGCTMLRNVATMMMKTIAMAASTARPSCLNASAWSALTPPTVYDAPAGMSRASSLVVRSLLTLLRLEPVTEPVTVAVRLPSVRVTCSGPLTCLTSATWLSGTTPLGVVSGSVLSAAVSAGAAPNEITTSWPAPSMLI